MNRPSLDSTSLSMPITKMCIRDRGEGQPVPEGTDVVITTLLTPAVRAYVEAGGRALLMQQEDGVLPVRRVAFWREGVLRQYDHEIVRPLKREMYCDELRYFSMTATSAIETDKLAERGFGDARPILRRSDCREWYASAYMPVSYTHLDVYNRQALRTAIAAATIVYTAAQTKK